jgi:hypothetical protein
LRASVSDARTWDEVLTSLALSPGSPGAFVRIKAHAIRLGLDIAHLDSPVIQPKAGMPTADLAHLRDAATALAAAWFGLRGCNAAFPG